MGGVSLPEVQGRGSLGELKKKSAPPVRYRGTLRQEAMYRKPVYEEARGKEKNKKEGREVSRLAK